MSTGAGNNTSMSGSVQGPKKRFEAVTSFDLLAETGKSYHARKSDTGNEWQKKTYLDHIESQSPAQLVIA